MLVINSKITERPRIKHMFDLILLVEFPGKLLKTFQPRKRLATGLKIPLIKRHGGTLILPYIGNILPKCKRPLPNILLKHLINIIPTGLELGLLNLEGFDLG
jgi:hypothetical protein